jgi:hypothetical protein
VTAATPAQALVQTTFTAVGPDPASIQGTVDAFRNALGPLNAPAPVSNPDGRREINWDAAPGSVSDPNPFPGDFFNASTAPRARGLAVTPVGSGGFGLSSDPGDAGAGQPGLPLFSLGPFGFQSFSPNRIFAVFGTNQFDVLFFNPANPSQAATVDGFGAVFVDVDDPGSKLEYFDVGGSLLATVDVPDQRFVTPEGSLSFAGATFTYEEVARVRVTAATSGLESCGSTTDCVAMDDFIFGEAKPVPVPPAIALLGAAIAGMGILGRRSRKA